ncbi:MAG: hypothetical protein ALECFALPRED_010073 [Alectoria fallacina]|uniref:Uncharacterized protein n=1 Tax=Alectoria fallacina TaxID=1903189 RepID=A0A8H3PKJ0_9LECA|nr:MAG: hypothetical protein ALECFALPRED_010073 [Alectoria fallacina]
MPNSSAPPPRSRATPPFHPVEPAALDPKIKKFLQQIEEIEQDIPPDRRIKAKVLCPVIQANQEAKRLGLENAPSRWCGGRDGWILWTRYGPFSMLARRKVEKDQLPVRISTLRMDEQCIAYRRLHQVATPTQLAKYYRLHCAQLDEMRMPPCFRPAQPFQGPEADGACASGKVLPLGSSCFKGADAACAVVGRGDRIEGELATRRSWWTRAYAHGLETLVEGCEALLRR